MRRLRAAAVALFGAAILAGALVVPRVTLSAAPRAGPVVYGYPYAASCPRGGERDVVDRWKMDECNCTSYAAWALEANEQRIDWFVPGEMDAREWPRVARAAGLAVGRRPAVGAVAVWADEARPFGHVAYVTAVDRSGRFDVAEYNLPAAAQGRRFAFDRRYGLRPRSVVFVYVPHVREGEPS